MYIHTSTKKSLTSIHFIINMYLDFGRVDNDYFAKPMLVDMSWKRTLPLNHSRTITNTTEKNLPRWNVQPHTPA